MTETKNKISKKKFITLLILNLLAWGTVIVLALTFYSKHETLKEDEEQQINSVTQQETVIDGIRYDMTENFLAIENENVTDSKDIVRIYSDMSCPYCKEFADKTDSLVRESLKNGSNVRFEFVTVNYLGARNVNDWTINSAQALAIVADKHPNAYLDTLTALYNSQPTADTKPEAVDKENVLKIVDTVVELSSDDKKLLTTDYYKKWVNEKVTPFAAGNNIRGIPATTINGKLAEDWDEVIEHLENLSYLSSVVAVSKDTETQ